MPISSGTRTRNLLATAVLLALSNAAMATPTEPGVSHDLAVARAARLSNIRYRLSFTLKEHVSAVAGTETLTFESRTAGDLSIDYRDGVIQSATLNGHPIPKELENGHLNLPAVVGQNTLTLAFISNAAPAGKAITRYEDKDDGNEYIYTLFVPMDASMAFPCFDQPDLKARFTLDLERPAGWSVIGNTAPVAVDDRHAQFAETRPISTYLFAFAAGRFSAVRSKNPTEPTVYVRKSQLTRAQQEASQVQQMAARGIAYLSDYFAQPFPFSKYDLVLIPGFPFSGMEHAGETFLNGCMTIQAALAGGVEGEPIRRKLIALRVKEQDALRRRFERAKSEDDLPSNADAADLARFVTAIYQGMTVQAINGASREDLLRLPDTALLIWPR